MATRLKIVFLTFLLFSILMEQAKPVLGKKGGGKFKKLEARVKKLEESMVQEEECEACSLIEQLTERLNAAEGEIEELKKPPPTNPPTLPPTEPPTQPPTEPPTEPPTLPPTEPPLPAPECYEGSYKKLDGADRKVTSGMGSAVCDKPMQLGWYRFTGAAGTKMPTTPPSINKCGTHATGWLNGAHPSKAEGKVSRQVCFHWSGNNCHWSKQIEVRNCGLYYIYKLESTPVCQLRYCGSD